MEELKNTLYYRKRHNERQCMVLGVVPKLIHGGLADGVVVRIMSFWKEVLQRV